MTTDYSKLLQVAHEAVDHAKPLFLNGTTNELTAKGDRDYATETDYQIERELRDLLAKATPDIGFLGEEDGHTGADQRYWCLDPIDGTVNYVHGNPLCGVSLALVEEDTPSIGVIDLPRLGNRYWAAPGVGAIRDGEPIQASNVDKLSGAVVSFGDFAVGPDSDEKNKQRLEIFNALVPQVLRIRMVGSAATDLAWVADGKLDATIIIGGYPWDVAAGTAIATAAGAQTTTFAEARCQITTVASSRIANRIATSIGIKASY